MQPRALHSLFLGVALALVLTFPVHALELVVHPGVAEKTLERKQARSLFSGRVNRWTDGSPVRVFVLPDDQELHQELAKQVLDIYPYQLRAAWERMRYTGMGQPPITVASEEEMRRRVAETPGAIGYVGKVQNHDKIRALPLR
ncbi:MAG: hypothetical protein AB1899_05995 [Pseudomonadota bacterium]